MLKMVTWGDILGDDLKSIREYINISQVRMSLACGWGGNYIGHIENGQIKNTSFKNAHKIAVYIVEELRKKKKTVREMEEYLGYMPLLDLLYVIENKERIMEDIEFLEVQ